MLRVDVVLCPYGDTENGYRIGRVDIANVGHPSDLADIADYEATVLSSDERFQHRTARVDGHVRSDGWLPLVARTLAALTEETNDAR